MNKIKLITISSFLLILFLSLLGLELHAATYYVAIGGNDFNSGTSSTPWRTIQKAANSVAAGDTVIVNAGTYNERVTISKSGINGALINFTASGNVECEGFTITANYIHINGFKVTATNASGADTSFGFWIEGSNCIIENNYAYYNPRGGITLRQTSSNCTISSNRCQRNGAWGIQIHGTNHLVEKNEIWGSIVYHTPTGFDNGDADGIRFWGVGHTFRSNYIHDINHDDPENYGRDPHIDGFQTWKTSVGEVASNIVFDRNIVILTTPKGNGFMTEDASNLTIKNNILICQRGMTQGGAGNHHFKILNNIFVGSLSWNPADFLWGIKLGNVPNSSIINNILYDQLGDAILFVGTTYNGLDADYNCYYNSNGSTPRVSNHYAHDLNSNPLLLDPAGRNYKLAIGSPCIDSGRSLSEVATDYDGISRPQGAAFDIGAYEYQATIPKIPIISNVSSSNITDSSATITWTTDQPSDTQVEYGATTGYGRQSSLNTSMVTSHSQTLSGLSSGTLYHFQVKSKDAAGNQATSADFTFTTTLPGPLMPTISNVSSSNITDSNATITWTTDQPSDTQVEYGATTSYGRQSSLNTSMVTSHSQTLSGLSSGTPYHFQVKSKDAAGSQATSADFTFTTRLAAPLNLRVQ